ncbi:MAG: hypothetical protein IAI48_07040 [Candidatus Eremiobacteraeota bacterium]|nr:hypothetical protein [Candidatus Eremiobacteraeota bacterium]
MHQNANVRGVAAVFGNRESAHAALEALRAASFAEPWMATTRPAEGERSQNDVAESSDGVLGTIGRFFTGEGNSLRRSLEDHGIDPDEATHIDEALAPLEAVVTVFVDDADGVSGAERILEGAGGRLASRTIARASVAATDGAHSLVVADTSFHPPMVGEEVFVERRPVFAQHALPLGDLPAERQGLSDML